MALSFPRYKGRKATCAKSIKSENKSEEPCVGDNEIFRNLITRARTPVRFVIISRSPARELRSVYNVWIKYLMCNILPRCTCALQSILMCENYGEEYTCDLASLHSLHLALHSRKLLNENCVHRVHCAKRFIRLPISNSNSHRSLYCAMLNQSTQFFFYIYFCRVNLETGKIRRNVGSPKFTTPRNAIRGLRDELRLKKRLEFRIRWIKIIL